MRKLYGKDLGLGYSDSCKGLFDLYNEKYKSALQRFNVAISVSPNNFIYYERRACTKLVLGDIEGALKDVDTFFKLFRPVYHQLSADSCSVIECCCLLLDNQLVNALAEMRKFHRYTIDYRIVAYLKGLALIKLKSYDEALKAFNFATEDPEWSMYGDLPVQLYEHAANLMKSILTTDFDFTDRNGVVKLSDWRYLFSRVWSECCEVSNHINKKHNNDANEDRRIPPILNEKMCARCQMSPCHCSDPDWN